MLGLMFFSIELTDCDWVFATVLEFDVEPDHLRAYKWSTVNDYQYNSYPC